MAEMQQVSEVQLLAWVQQMAEIQKMAVVHLTAEVRLMAVVRQTAGCWRTVQEHDMADERISSMLLAPSSPRQSYLQT